MSNTPERNLDPPKDDAVECPDCEGDDLKMPWCKRCGGDGVVSKAEEQRELEAAIGDREYDRREDDKWRREEEGKKWRA